MKKHLSYGLVIGTLAVSGMTSTIISSKNLDNNIQETSISTRKKDDIVAPIVSSFEWTEDENETQENFTIKFSYSGSYIDQNGETKVFSSENFDQNNSSITYLNSGLSSEFTIKNWAYDDNETPKNGTDDQITGTAVNLTKETIYDGITLTLGYQFKISDDLYTYQFKNNADFDISNTNGNSFMIGKSNNSSAPTITSFEWEEGINGTVEDFTIILDEPGSYLDDNNNVTSFSKNEFSSKNSAITYGDNDEEFIINNWNYDEQSGNDVKITGSAINLTVNTTYNNINLTLGYIANNPAVTYQFSSNSDLNGDEKSPDLDISDLNGNSFVTGKNNGSLVPVITEFDWTPGSIGTEENFIISLNYPGSYSDFDGQNIDFKEENFSSKNSSITYGGNNEEFTIKNWKYEQNDYDVHISGTATDLIANTTYDNINFTLGYVVDGISTKYQFASNDDLNGDGINPDLDISNTEGESFSIFEEEMPSFSIDENAQWENVSDESATLSLNIVDWGTKADGSSFTEEDLDSDLSYVAYNDKNDKKEHLYKGVEINLENTNFENSTVDLVLSNLDSNTNYQINHIVLAFDGIKEIHYSDVNFGENELVPLATEKSSLSGRIIFAIVIGSILVVSSIFYSIYYFKKKKAKNKINTIEE